MSIFRRRPAPQPAVPAVPSGPPFGGIRVPSTAVPLIPADVQTIVEALQRHAQQMLRDPLRSAGDKALAKVEHARANELLETAGVAATLGHTSVPLLISDLDALNRSLQSMQAHRLNIPCVARLAHLLSRLATLSGVAKVKGWTATHSAYGLAWTTEPVVSDIPQLEAGAS